jgi:hypothetical protein
MKYLAKRLGRLEYRFGTGKEVIRHTHVINFVDANGTVTAKLTITHGDPVGGQWWYAPGHERQQPEYHVGQMPADVPR